MSVELHPDINSLDPESLCYSIYRQLYQNFFNAQDEGSVLEGDPVSIRLHNTAYGFAEAVAGAVEGNDNSSSGGVLLEYVKKSGGDMTGMLRANYGFEAGFGNSCVLKTYSSENGDGDKESGVEITGNLRLGGENLFIGEKQVLSYLPSTQTTTLSGARISFGDSGIVSTGEWVIGANKERGVYFSPLALMVNGHSVYHSGNANVESVSWSMKDAVVKGSLEVTGRSLLKGALTAHYGASLGIAGNEVLSVSQEEVRVKGWMKLTEGYGIRLNTTPVLSILNKKDLELAVAGGDLLLGSEQTNKILLSTGIMDYKGSYMLLSKYGAAYFPESLVVRHNYGDVLFSSYRQSASDEGMVIHKKLRFGDGHGSSLSGETEGITLTSSITHIDPVAQTQQKLSYQSRFFIQESNSFFKPLNRVSHMLGVDTDADFIHFNKPVEVKSSFGIENSYTRLCDNKLLFSDHNFLLSATDGIKHSGNAYFLDGISSERFSSGFAGIGWAIYPNKTSGSVVATFDELTVRKKMRIYEMEVQKINTTNGSLWVSDHCQGDSVIKL